MHFCILHCLADTSPLNENLAFGVRWPYIAVNARKEQMSMGAEHPKCDTLAGESCRFCELLGHGGDTLNPGDWTNCQSGQEKFVQ